MRYTTGLDPHGANKKLCFAFSTNYFTNLTKQKSKVLIDHEMINKYAFTLLGFY